LDSWACSISAKTCSALEEEENYFLLDALQKSNENSLLGIPEVDRSVIVAICPGAGDQGLVQWMPGDGGRLFLGSPKNAQLLHIPNVKNNHRRILRACRQPMTILVP